MGTTLAESLKPVSADWKTLHKNYNPLLNLVRELIGIIPNCDLTLEIWQPGFRTYNLLVPNMFNLPGTLFGSKSFKASMGLAMYASSKAACAYCTAHACSFALRRGMRTEAIAGARTEKEQAVVALAEGLAHVPANLTLADIEKAKQHFSPSEIERLVYAISMMGFLNKFMNATGVELEQGAINDTADLLSQTGWQPGIHANNGFHVTNPGTPQQDSILTYLRVIRHAPGAVLWEKQWIKGVPSEYIAAAAYLKGHTGYSFPILKPVQEGRVIRTITTVLRDNLDKNLSVTGLKIKMYAGYIFSYLVQNDELISMITGLSAHVTSELNDEQRNRLVQIVQMEIPADSVGCKEAIILIQQQLSLTEKEAAAVLLSLAAAYSPAQVNDAIIETALKHMEAAAIVEIVVWLSILQLLNRLSSFYTTVKKAGG